ncbi:MAG TPA: Ig-like domain-containing protein [Mycobacteriales bacterium]|nr:Ig-like domain-containing protein [Mycobacteriales bacterium]
MPSVLRRIGLLTLAAAIAAPALPALAASGPPADKASAPTVASVFGKGHDPDLVGNVDPSTYLTARQAYLEARTGNPLRGGHGDLRLAAVAEMRQQRRKELAATSAAPSSTTSTTTTASGTTTDTTSTPTAPSSTLSWSPLGPSPLPSGQTQTVSNPVSGRATAIAIDPTNKNIVYVGAADGGVFRTLDGGTTWTPIADSMQVLSIGALAIAPNSPSTLYVGTGESNIGQDSFAGVGLYRIDNASGTSPSLVGPINPAGSSGWNDGHAFTGQSISKIIVSPTNAGSVLVSTISGNVGKYGTQRDATGAASVRGVYRSSNASGAIANITFTQLSSSADIGTSAGVTDMTLDPHDPTTALVGVSYSTTNGSAAEGVWRAINVWSTPTWTHVLTPPSGNYSVWRFGASAPSGAATSTIYAADDESNGVVRMSTDGGVTWSGGLPAFGGHCGGQCWYDDPVAVSPTNTAIVLAGGDGGSPLRKSIDSGQTQVGTVDTGLHADAHAIAFAPNDSSTVWIGNDGGVFKSSDAGSTWVSENTGGLNSLQFMSLSVGASDPEFSIGGTQDNGTEMMQANGTWGQADYGDGGATAIDQSTTSTTNVTMYHTYYNIQNNQIGFARVTNGSNAQRGYWPFYGCGSGATANGINCADATQFYAPMTLGPGTPNTLYFGTDRLYRSTDQGAHMTVVSQAPLMSGATLTAIGISPTDDNRRIVGLSNGHVFVTTSGSSTLTDVTGGWPTTAGTAVVVDDAKIDPLDANTAFVALGNYFGTTSSSHLWKTTNLNGTTPTWTGASGLPDTPVNAIAIDPSNDKFVYVGTDIGVYYSKDGGSTFAPLGLGLPPVAVFDLKIVQAGTSAGTLRIATHGRGVWQYAIGDAAAPSSVTLSPTNPSVTAGGTQAFVATAHYDDGSTTDVTSQATWSSSDPTVATVTAGTATGKAQGAATITATYHGVQGGTTLTVAAPTLTSFAVTPSTANVAKGATTKLTATGTYSDGSTKDLSDSAAWATDTSSVATVDTHGVVTGVSQGGPATISATFGAFMASSAVTVTAAVVTAVTVAPGTNSVPLGDSAPFTASATWSDGSVTDVTSSASWSSSNTAVATVTGGAASTKSVGGTTISATAGGKTGTASLTVTAAVLRTVTVTPSTVTVAKGQQTQLHATGTFSDGSTQDLTSAATWTSGSTGTATVDALGLVTGVAQGGPVTITATSGGSSGSSAVTVGPAVVTAVTISPSSPTVAKGDTRQLTATATWSDGTTKDVTGLATWTSATPSVATIDASGLATSVAQGTSVIGASYSGSSDSTTLTVTAAALRSVTVSPNTATIAKGDTQTFTVTGHYSDGSSGPVTTGITWSAGPASTATITTAGVATGAGVGDASITATVSGYAGTATLTVTAPVLRSVAVAPNPLDLPKGNSAQLSVTGTFSDGTTQDVTSSASWSSADTGVATVSGGLVQAVAQGGTTVTATVSGYSGQSSVNVGPAVVTGLAVTASPSSLPLGDHSQMTAVATYSDGTTQDVTAVATWASDADTVATVSSAGVVTTKSVGTAGITATYQSISHSATVTVTAAVLRSVAVTPASPTVPVGLTQQLTATGTYSDGSQMDVTGSASWASGTPTVATVDAHGVVTGVSQGTSSVTATVAGVSSPAVTVTVSAPVVSSVVVSPSSTSAVKGDSVGFTAAAHWSDHSVTDVTSAATWASSDQSVATMSGPLASAVGVGTATVSATTAGKTGTASLTVSSAALRSIAVTPSSVNIAQGLTVQLTATGTYSDGSTQDLTNGVTWQSDQPSTASVDSAGLVTGAQQGTATVTATISSLTSQSNITVGGPVVTALSVTPRTPSVAAGDTQPFAATATWSAGAPTDVTDLATWSSGTPSVATVDGHGLATSIAQGTSVIGASYGGSADSATLTVNPPALRSVTVSPGAASVAKGDSQTFSVTGHYSDGTSAPVTTGITWSVGTPSVASLTSAGVATGVGVGSSTVTATVGGSSDSATLTVTAAELRGIAIDQASPTVNKGQDVALTATGTYSDSTTRDVTASVSWASGNEAVATVDSAGSVHGVSEGQATITASANGLSGQVTVTVDPAVVTGLHVSPASGSVPLGETAQLAATATMSDGTQPDVTGAAEWSSSDTGVATVNSNGLVTTVSTGTAQITATYGGAIDAVVVTVTAPVLQSIDVSPQALHVARGLTTQLTAVGTYSDNSTSDLTQTATWTPGDASTATVDAWGTVTGVAEGTTTITASVGTVTSAPVDVTVDPAVVTGLTVSSTTTFLPMGTQLPLTATATWSAGDPTDVTGVASWSSDTPTVATVDSNGLVSSVGQGSTTVSASYGGASSSVYVTVTPPALTSVTLASSATDLAKGDHATLALTGHYTDGASAVIPSDQVIWSSSDESVAWVSNGDAMTVGEGTTTITAMAQGKSDSVVLTVGPAVLRSITIAPSGISLPKGDVMSVTAVGVYSDGTGQPITDPVTWSTDDPSVAGVDAGGVLTGLGVGQTTVTATADGFTASEGVDVTAPQLVELSVAATPQSVPLGDHSQMTASGTYSDATTSDLTSSVTWTSDNIAVAKVSAAGVVTSVGQGTADITATYTVGQVQRMQSAVVTVTAPVLRSLVLTPTTYTLKPGRTKQYVATGTFSDGTKRNVSSSVHWSTGNTKIAKVGATGVVTGVNFGTTAVRAVSGAVSAVAVSVHVTHKAPTVTGFSPLKGKVGTLVTITGSNFVKKPVMTVKFGSTKAGTITFVSSTKIRVRVPKGARTAYIYVTNDGGTGRSKSTFHVVT